MKHICKTALALALVLLLIVPGAPARATTEDNIQFIFNYLTTTMGLTRAAACGVLANIRSESNFNPASIGDNGTSFGICQWHLARGEAMKNFCLAMGCETWIDLEGQLGYLAKEFGSNKKPVGDYLKTIPDTAQGAYDAAYDFCVRFEIPANRYAKGVTRGTNAVNTYWTKFGGTVAKYTVTYNANGGTNAPAAQQKTEGVPFLITSLAPQRTGYKLAGWAESASAAQVRYAPGDTYTENRPVTLFAVWERALEAETPYTAKTTYGGHTYEYYSAACTWEYAQWVASIKGGYLASARTAQEHAAIASLVSGAGGACWLGGNYVCGNWVWDGGEAFLDAFAQDKWAQGSPCVEYGASANGRLAQNADGTWADLAPTSLDPVGFIVEYGEKTMDEFPTYVINVSTSLNLRNGPGTGYAVLSAMLPGTRITISDIWKGASYDWGWGVTNGGARGWCAVRVPNYMTLAGTVDEETGFSYTLTDGGAALTGYTGAARNLVLPETLAGQTVCAIESGAFTGANAPASVTVPDCVFTIASGAFSAQTALTGSAGGAAHLYAIAAGNRFTILRPEDAFTPPDALLTIGANAFENASGLVFIDLSQTRAQTIEANAFAGCDNLRVVLLPDTLAYISGAAFPTGENILFIITPGTPAANWARALGYTALAYTG